MNVIGIIPARYASTRFPGKPLVKINGKTMIQRVYEQGKLAVDELWVATDDDRIKTAVEAFSGNVVMTSSKHRSGTDRVVEAVNKISALKSCKFDIVVNIQGDEPFIHPSQIKELVNCFDSPKTQIASLIKLIDSQEDLFDPNKVKVVVNDKLKALYFSRFAIPFLRGIEEKYWLQKGKFYKHIGMYAYQCDVLKEITKLPPGELELAESLEQLRWMENGYQIQLAITNHESTGIDTPEDLEKIISAYKSS